MKKLTALVALMAALSISVAYASEMTGAYENGVYTVSGTADTAGMPVRIEILKNGYVFDDLKNVEGDSIGDYYLYADQTVSGEDKSFGFTVNVPGGAANHVVRVSFFGSDITLPDSFATYSEEDMNTAVAAFLSDDEKTADKLKALINSYYGKLGVDYDSFKKLDADIICQNVVDSIESGWTTGDLKASINANIVAEQIDNADTEAKVVEILDLNAEKLGIKSTKQWTEWNTLKAEEKQSIAGAFKGAGLSADEICESLKDKIVIYELNNALWNEQQEILEKYDEDTKLSETEISKVTNSNQLKNIFSDFKTMTADGVITKCSQIKGEIDKLVDKYYIADGGTATPAAKPGLGFSGGGGGSVSISSPKTEEEQPVEIKQPFDDIADVEWAHTAITYLYREGIINGKSESEFCPNDNITREEYAAMLVRSFDIDTKNAECDFADVMPGRWSYEYIAAAKQAGIVNGISDSLFGTEDNISRQDMATMAYRAAKLYGAEFDAEKTNDFADADTISDYARESVDMMAAAGIINGTGSGFEPLRRSTRAEAAKVIYGLLLHCGIIG